MMDIIKTRALIFLSLTLLLSFSCELKKDFYLKGIVINEGNQQPISGAKVYFKDGLESGDFLGGTSPDNFDNTTTDIEGRFELGFRSKSSHGFVSVAKEGYVQYTEDGTIQGVNQGDEINSSMVLMMHGVAYYNPIFKKVSELDADRDTLKVYLLSKRSLSVSRLDKMFIGTSPFEYTTIPNYSVNAIGDSYQRYKLEFNSSTGWKTIIDSVYIPTSPEVFRGDTIHY